MSDDSVTLQIMIDGDPSSSVAAVATAQTAYDALVASIEKGSSQIVAALEKQTAAHVGGAAKTKESLSSVQQGVKGLEDQISKAFSAKTLIEDFGRNLVALVGPIALIEAGLEAVKEVIHGIVEFSKEGIIKADQIRDLGLSLTIFTGGANSAGKAAEFFERHLWDTRDTAERLEETLRTLEPLMTSRGFSRDLENQIPLMLSQLATIRGESMDAMEGGLSQLLAGRVSAGRNPLLKSLGITKADVDGLGWDTLFAKMREVSAHFPEFGQSFKSELDKIKEYLVVTFAEGFNEARDSAKSGLDAIRDALNDPAIRGAIRDLGRDVADAFREAGTAAEIAAHSSLISWGSLLKVAVAAQSGPAAAAAAAAQIVGASTAQAIPALNDIQMRKGDPGWQGSWLLKQIGLTVQTQTPGFKDQADLFTQTSQALADMSDKGKVVFVKELTEAIDKGSVSIRIFRKAEDDAFAVDYSGLGKIKQDTKDIGKAAEDAADKLIDANTRERESNAQKLALLGDYDASQRAAIELQQALAEHQREATDAIDTQKKTVEGSTDTWNKLTAAKRDALAASVALTKADRDYTADIEFLMASGKAFQDKIATTYGSLSYTGQNQLTPYELINQGTLPTSGMPSWLNAQTIAPEEFGRKFAAQIRLAATSSEFTNDLARTVGAELTSGGAHFGQIAAREFSRLATVGLENIFAAFTPHQGDTKLGQDPNYFYVGASKQALTPSQLKAANAATAAVGGVDIGLGAYQAVLQGGSRTGATLSGGLAGVGLGAELAAGTSFSAFGATGAVAGGIVGLIAGVVVAGVAAALATAAKQDQYKYGVPGIDATGHAYFSETKNYTDADAKAIVRQIQATYDTIHDSLVRTLMKLDNVIVPIMGAIDGRFQPNPSGHFEQHLQTWESSTEGDLVFKQFESEFDAVRAQLGISVEKWNATMSDLNLVDPMKRAQLFDQLVTGKLAINKALQFFVGENYGDMLPKGSTTYESYTYKLSTHQPFTEQQKEADDEILRFATNIKGLSFEGQIAAEAELGQKMTDRASAIRSAIEGIFQAFEDGTKKYRDAFEQTDVLGFTSDTGTVDQAGLAKYYKQRAQDDLTRERFAQNPQLVSQFNDQFIADIMKAGQAALASGATAASVAAWEREQLQAGEKAFDAQLTKLGTDIDKLNTSFTSQLDPALQALYSTTNGVNTVIGDVGNHLHDIIDPIDRVGAGANSVADQLNNMSDALSRFSEQITTLQFIARTVASRGAA